MLTQRYQLEQSNNLVVVSIEVSPLDMTTMQEIIDDLMQRMRCDNAVYFVLDMHQVEFVGSACIGLLVQFMQEVEHVRGRIALAACRSNVSFLFKITKLDMVFQLYDDLEEAKLGIHGG
ncbi:MAG: STAS domain-containing protein [Phycisphaerales bacterium]|nr:STAS domain-containing protein [Phycisphaerales bacterium]